MYNGTTQSALPDPGELLDQSQKSVLYNIAIIHVAFDRVRGSQYSEYERGPRRSGNSIGRNDKADTCVLTHSPERLRKVGGNLNGLELGTSEDINLSSIRRWRGQDALGESRITSLALHWRGSAGGSDSRLISSSDAYFPGGGLFSDALEITVVSLATDPSQITLKIHLSF